MNNETQFAKRLKKAGWFVYLHDKTGRMVTNAYPNELQKLEKLSGVACEIVEPPSADCACARIAAQRREGGSE